MFRVIVTLESALTDGTPETRVVSRHRTRQAAERSLAAYHRDFPLFYRVVIEGKKQLLKVLGFCVQDDTATAKRCEVRRWHV